METAVGEAIVGEIRRLSTAGFREIRIETPGRPRRSRPAVIAATTGAPVPGGARLQVACDVPAEVEIELSYSRRFEPSWRVRAGRTGDFHTTTKTVRGLDEGRRVHWRARVRRHGRTATSPPRSFRVLPRSGSREAISLAVASCGSQFGPIFGHLAARRPDVFVWQGDLNYPDTHGPLAQTVSGYAGIWRDFLANPVLEPVLERAAFAAQRDDHDYAVQDANARLIAEHPWGLGPWNALMNRRTHFRFPAGAAEVWVLDQRRFKTDPQAPASPAKTLLGRRQRRWLFETLAASRAPFKVVCSPTSVFMAANPRDGSWAAGFEAERELLLRHIRRGVEGTTIFLTGDVHLTGVHEADGWFEARAAPVGIPTPNDVTLLDPLAASNLARRPGVVYADDRCHLTMLTVRGVGRDARLELELMREDGEVPYRRVFEAS
jgi:alkaline phosphatase D